MKIRMRDEKVRKVIFLPFKYGHEVVSEENERELKTPPSSNFFL